jgi:hypothetical protein
VLTAQLLVSTLRNLRAVVGGAAAALPTRARLAIPLAALLLNIVRGVSSIVASRAD